MTPLVGLVRGGRPVVDLVGERAGEAVPGSETQTGWLRVLTVLPPMRVGVGGTNRRRVAS